VQQSPELALTMHHQLTALLSIEKAINDEIQSGIKAEHAQKAGE
jgi:hypothetical protein